MKKPGTITAVQCAAILSIFLFGGAGSFMNAAVQTMMEAWPDLAPSTVRMVTSLPSLTALPVTIWVGTAAGRFLSFRFCSIAGTALILLAGAAPFVLHGSWGLVLFFRALVGVGVGLIAVRNALVLRSVPEKKQAAVIGYGSAIFNLGGMIAGPVVGILASIGWQYSFLYDLLALVPLCVMLFFLKEPEGEERAAEESGTAPVTAGKVSLLKAAAYVLLQFVSTMALYPLLSGMSTYMAVSRTGSAFLAGLAVSAYNLGGVLINLVLAPLVKALGKRTLPAVHLAFAFGMALIVFFPGVPGIFTGAAVCGIAFNTLISVYQLYSGRVLPPRQATFVSTLLIAALGLGNFASVYYIDFCQRLLHRASDIHSTYFATMLVYAALTLLCLFLPLSPDEERA